MTPEHGRESRDDEADESATPPGGKLKTVLGYAGVAAAPLALVALGAAVAAFMGNHATQARLSEVTAELQTVNANLLAIRNELESLKFIVTRQKAQLDAERKQGESTQQPVVAPAVPQATPPATNGTPPKQEQKPEQKPAASAPVAPAPAAPAKTPAKAQETKPVSKPGTTTSGKSDSKQLQDIREAIEKFNQK